MKKSIVLAVVATLSIVGAVWAGDTNVVKAGNSYSLNSLSSNLYFSVGAGLDHGVTIEDTSMFEAVGANLGLPIAKLSDGVVIGGQVGAGVALAETENDHALVPSVTIGAFARNLKVGSNQAAAGLFLDYIDTAHSANLLSLRPIAGMTIDTKNEIGITGQRGLVQDHGQEITDEVSLFWTHNWNSKVTSSAKVGYQFDDVDEAIWGPSVEYALKKNLSIVGSSTMNGNRDYLVSVSFVFGPAGQNQPILEQIRGDSLKPFNR
jgi:hypothetical protein